MLAAVDSNPVQWSGDPVVFPLEHVCDHSADWYRTRGYRYLVINEDHRSPECRAAYAELLTSGDVLARYPDRSTGERLGPGGAVLDLGEHAEQMPFTRRDITFGPQLTLVGYEMQPGTPRTRITPLAGAAATELAANQEQTLQINLYWRARAALPHDYWLFVHVLNAQGERVAQRDAPLRGAEYPASQWQAGELVIDRADLLLPALPPGRYQVVIGVYDVQTGQRPGAVDGADGSAVLTTLDVVAAE
jgi:hypothetical protein